MWIIYIMQVIYLIMMVLYPLKLIGFKNMLQKDHIVQGADVII